MGKESLKKIIPFQLQQLGYALLGEGGIRSVLHNRRIIKGIRSTGVCRTVIVVSSLPMMRYEGLRELLCGDPRFDVNVLIVPFRTWEPSEQQKAIRELSDYFERKGVTYRIGDSEHPETAAWLTAYRPQLMLYPQPYEDNYELPYDWTAQKQALLAYQNYGFTTVKSWWSKNLLFHNQAWRIFAANSFEKEDFKKMCYRRGRNVRVTFDAEADKFLAPAASKPWKSPEDGKARKRVIFAPHFQIQQNELFNRAAFIWLGDFMLEMAEKYKDSIQFAFKPHPRLRTALYEHPDWGPERTDAYYKRWAEGENTQFESGEYMDLFKDSDAMIHNCGSFTAEYLFTGNPVLFTTKDLREITDTANDFGLKCIEAHNMAATTEEVEDFIRKCVLGNEDPKKAERESFKQRYLLPPAGESAAGNMYREILHGLKFA